ncbi:hypothetical protein [Enterococcus mundtii]|uniref:hypothetical protein n=1 Tax=Enterococcus mundtii TaxID=53346 RepID=UPI001FBBDF7E|nr:hypothetical protein [Enterococcus mundtii]GKS55981.1 hypothetical protein EMLAB_25960 [Enterococcus mundtii]
MELVFSSVQNLLSKSLLILELLKYLLFASIFFPIETTLFLNLIINLLPKEFIQIIQVDSFLHLVTLFSVLSLVTFLIQVFGTRLDIVKSVLTIKNPTADDESLLDKVNTIFSTFSLVLIYLFLIYSQSFNSDMRLNIINSEPNTIMDILATFSLFMIIILFFIHLFSYLFVIYQKKLFILLIVAVLFSLRIFLSIYPAFIN